MKRMISIVDAMDGLGLTKKYIKINRDAGVKDYGRRKALEHILESKKRDGKAYSTDEILQIIHEGRRGF